MGYYGYYGYYDWTYVLVLVGAVITLLASAVVKLTFNKYSKERSMTGMTGQQASYRLLQYKGYTNIPIRPVGGELTDHYDPRSDTINLSQPVYGASSIAAIGVAAHETGHAMQHVEGYVPLQLRASLVPAVNICSTLSWPVIIAGFLFNGSMSTMILNLGIALFSVAVLFHIVTLPVEINASKRGLQMLRDTGVLSSDELRKARRVLIAAALTYVASAAAAILQLVRIVLLSNGRRNND